MAETWDDRLYRAARGAQKALGAAAVLPEADATEIVRDALRALLLVVLQHYPED